MTTDSRVSSALTCAPGRRCYIHADPRQISPTAASLTDWDLNDARVHTHLNLTEPSAVWIPRIHEVTAVRLPAFGGIRRRRRIGRAWISRRHLHIHLKLLHFFFFNPRLSGTKRGLSPSLSGLVPRPGAMEQHAKKEQREYKEIQVWPKTTN